MSFSSIAATFPAEPALGSLDAFMTDFSAPRLDDSVFDGSLLHMLTQQDAHAHALAAAAAAAPRPPSSSCALLPSGAGTAWGALDLDMENVEDIFDDLRASCGMPPCDIYDDGSADAEPQDLRVLESAFGGLGFVPAQDVAAVFISDSESDSDSDSDEVDEGGVDLDADGALAAALAAAVLTPRRSARVPKPKIRADDVPPVRTSKPKAAASKSWGAAPRAAGPVRNSTSSSRAEARAEASPIRRNRTQTQQATFTRAPVPAAAVARAQRSGATLPAESANARHRRRDGVQHPRLRAPDDQLHGDDAPRADALPRRGGRACPLVFAREDSCERHRQRMQCWRDDNPARRALIPVFNELAEVLAVREDLEQDERHVSRVNQRLRAMWIKFVKDGST
ncbi:hypothetical protein GGX14DRAFT_676194 [Mycena pura]|uniref:Uncharacterized protein n=1 Tax=Mycena pura TaxID=153505 RepID=A0AAD6VRW5_9AGAR|nr:hypothetical protein GGX14DRAFT_676194 [Mycena pura]